jgi:Skp family chaperone for outer membrane proteins
MMELAMLPRVPLLLSLAGLTSLALACAHAPPRADSVDLRPSPGTHPALGVAHESSDPSTRGVAKQDNINLVFECDQVVYAAPDIDLTPTSPGHPKTTLRMGESVAVINFQRALDTTREGRQARAQLKAEFERKQAELDQRQLELKAKYGQDAAGMKRSPEFAALNNRFLEMRREMAEHEQAAVRALLMRMKSEVAELARGRRIDIVVAAALKGDEVVDRAGVAYHPRIPDLTDELIRLHDERAQ